MRELGTFLYLVKSRPYWQYSAVNDSRTRPSHSMMSGLVYRYDDPFWATFYPPNGFNCRCSVIALNARDIEDRGIDVGNSDERLAEIERDEEKPQKGKTIAYRLPNGKMLMADKGFDYNSARMSYRPNLDDYPESLAHQFAKKEMAGGGFKWGYKKLENFVQPYLPEYKDLKTKAEKEVFLNGLRDQFSQNFKFAAGVLSPESLEKIGTELKTIWFSDDSLIKQIANREGQFGVSEYEVVPDVLLFPDEIKPSAKNHYELYKMINDKKYLVVIKVLEKVNEIYLVSFRRDNK